jgi:RNA polymerase sigma-70 factor (ECF subfamily)
VFQIATHLAYNQLKRSKRWTPDVSEQAKALVLENPALAGRIQNALQADPEVRYEIKEHIDTCFTCIGRNLPIEQQITLLLRDVYGFNIEEISNILSRSAGSVKHLLQSARGSMTEIFDRRCALVNKNGVCRQCSELNGWLNPKQDQQAALMQLDLVNGSARYDRDALYKLRAALVREIDPLRSPGAPLQEILLGCNRMAMGEVPVDSNGAAN